MRTGLIFLLLSFFLASGVNSRVFECDDEGKCPAGKCVSGICNCPAGEDFSKDSLSCLPLARGYGDQCEEDIVCSTLKGISVCYEGTCKCAEGWVYWKGECMKKKDFGETCSNNEECFDGSYYNARICKDGKCECNKGFYKRGNDDCRHISSEFDNLCVLDSDCKEESLRCIVGICSKPVEEKPEGPKDYYHVHDQERSVVEPRTTGDKCNVDVDCVEPNTHCSPIFKECTCDKGYFYTKESKKCAGELGSSCEKDKDCVINNSQCSGKVCVCKTTNFLYLQTHGNQKCSKPSTASKFTCSNNESCKVFLRDYECLGDIEKVCHCKGELNKDNICEKVMPGTTCINDESCQYSMKNSVCSPNKICVCPKDFVFDNDMCIGGIGSTCNMNDDCRLVDSALCKENVCVCDKGYIDHENMCYKLSNGLGEVCEIDVQCSNINQAECKDQRCSCAPGHIDVNGFCYKVAENFGERCPTPIVCSELQGSVCWNGICQCPLGMVSTNKKSCINGAAGLFLAPLALLVVVLSIVI
ncbi:PREDICTED: prion-like-(Q/N-rich) domain-bearing protein 25 [Nicrophorus vespilloides]|uniref:Prion-like-(Q/N-rich) domain-bearing protein 25 n=1 Tax=Nicrophorus vespilloides TaxID=110193 RepID=A0ABM1MVT0_NICVS|nr:PREDICTED: prion-like-(Q/N-rich) domain-bearing protein 25 [Nicrophorus vespilloides]